MCSYVTICWVDAILKKRIRQITRHMQALFEHVIIASDITLITLVYIFTITLSGGGRWLFIFWCCWSVYMYIWYRAKQNHGYRWLIMSPTKFHIEVLWSYSTSTQLYILIGCPEVKKYCYAFTDQSIHALRTHDENLHLPPTKTCPTSSIKLKPVSLFANTCNQRKDLDHI